MAAINDNSTGSAAAFVETVADTSTTIETGNSVTGDYAQTISDTTTTTDTDAYSDADGTVVVNEGSSQTSSGTQTGNNISGVYTLSQTAANSYSTTETATLFTLNETDSLTSTTTETGNNVEGTYSRSVTGVDNYTMNETGINANGNNFSQSITGSDTYTLTETGNSVTQVFARETIGAGSYTETLVVTIGGTPVTTTPSGSYTYDVLEGADAKAGAFIQTADYGRYNLLVYFTDVSNAEASTPGNMNFSPLGQAFADPGAQEIALAVCGVVAVGGFGVGLFGGPAGADAAVPVWGPARNIGDGVANLNGPAIAGNGIVLVLDIAAICQFFRPGPAPVVQLQVAGGGNIQVANVQLLGWGARAGLAINWLAGGGGLRPFFMNVGNVPAGGAGGAAGAGQPNNNNNNQGGANPNPGAPQPGNAPPKLPINNTRPQHGTPAHDATAFNVAKAWEGEAATVEARFNQTLVDANGNVIPQFRPDSQRTRRLPGGGIVVDVTEVRSPGQTDAFMNDKIARIRQALGDQAGEIRWIEPIPGAVRN